MAYIPGSKLLANGEKGELGSYVMVLSDNKVIFIGNTYNGQTMSLTDWLILAEGREMQLNSVENAEAIWNHAKEKSGIDPPSLVHVDEYEMSTLPQLLVPPPVPQLSSPAQTTMKCCDNEYACGCLELSAHATASHLPEPSAEASASRPPELRFPPPLAETYPERHMGDKLKWQLNDETYRIVVFTDKGVLQVKSVTDGGGETHTKDCTCAACWEYNRKAPWRPRAPLAKTFFESEKAWRDSLPKGGKLLKKCPGDINWA
jgi:hypothetical protein